MGNTPISADAQKKQDDARVGGKFGEQTLTAAPASVGANLKEAARAPLRSLEAVFADQRALTARNIQATQDEFDLGREELIVSIIQDFPGASEAVIYNSGADDGESRFAVKEILGADNLYHKVGDLTVRSDSYLNASLTLDRFGLEYFAQPADDDHAKAWHGFKFDGCAKVRSLNEIFADQHKVGAERVQIAQDEFDLGREELVITILQDFPGATEAVIFNAGAETRDSSFAVREISCADGVCWNSDDDANKLFLGYMDASVALDRFGLKHLAQPADIDHAEPWFGIKF